MGGLFDGTALEQAVTCRHCGQALTDCACPQNGAGVAADRSAMPVRVRREKRRGKWMTVVYQLDLAEAERKKMLKTLKGRCASGGALTDDGVEVQGDHKAATLTWLKAEGFKGAKAAGG